MDIKRVVRPDTIIRREMGLPTMEREPFLFSHSWGAQRVETTPIMRRLQLKIPRVLIIVIKPMR